MNRLCYFFALNIGFWLGVFAHSMYAHAILTQFDLIYAHGYILGPLIIWTNLVLQKVLCKDKKDLVCACKR